MVNFALHLPGVQISGDYKAVLNTCREAERLGFDAVWTADHFYAFPRPTSRVFLEGWTTLSALSRDLDKIRIGTLVLSNLYRHPAVLAKMASTLDVISEGRLEFGIGAGYQRIECEGYGIPLPRPAIRVKMLRESVKVIKKLWTESDANFSGEFYSLKDAVCEPKPVQKPHPPIWIGAKGTHLTMRVVAELADGYNVPNSVEDKQAMLTSLKEHCRIVGRNYEEITKSMLLPTYVYEDESEVKKKLDELSKVWGRSEEYMRNTMLLGTPDQCIEQIESYKKMGYSYFIFGVGGVTAAPLKILNLLAEQVLSVSRKK
ncbi:MAG: TIGR03560 family F420-dependent LLM class oxidoreductase [Nitrososphaerales archaeon]